MSVTEIAVVIGAALAALLALWALLTFVVGRVVVVPADEFYVTNDWNQNFKRALPPGTHFLLNFRERLVNGEKAPLYTFPSRDSQNKEAQGQLRLKSGAISKRTQFCAPVFTALTQESLHMLVEPLVQFRADLDRAKDLVDVGENFGLALCSRIKQAFTVEFGKREDQELKDELKSVEDSVLKTLQEIETREPLGVVFETISFNFRQDREPHRLRRAVLGPQLGPDVVTSAEGRSPHPEGVAFMEAAEYDVIMNLFTEPDKKMQALLAILEMQTRRDIAEALAKSKQLVVVTAQELGLASSSVQLEAMRAKGLPPAPSR